ncbi:MAG: DUF4864 domain-containing protein [Paracoccaceae bacterium]
MHRFPGRFLALLAAVFLAIEGPARADEPADSIQAVIVAQLDALQANDLAGAFAHASPAIQSKFGTPEVFQSMVETGYPMIWRPARYQMLVLAETAAGPVQTVLFQDRQGRLFEAAYEMQLIDGVWRINGVTLRALPGIGS